MSSKNHILSKLRAAQTPFTDIPAIESKRKMINVDDVSLDALRTRFMAEAEKLGCYVYPAEDNADALNKLLGLLADSSDILAWDDEHLPFPIVDNLSEKGIGIAAHDDGEIAIGVTGVDSALAATGSLVVSSGQGKFRTTSLLPDKHIALVKSEQLLPDLETWVSTQKDTDYAAFKVSSNTTIISGPSKTADIAQELVKGAHGPRQVHIILID